MKRKTFLIILTTIIILSTTFPLITLAHSGRTDQNGGHWNTRTGEYHYHCGGYPAHQHKDGVCPYKSKPKENTESNNTYVWIIVGIAVIGYIVYKVKNA